MRLVNYLNEEHKAKKLAAPFLKEFGKEYASGNYVWRGHKDVIQYYKLKKRRTNRKPRLLDQELHEFLGRISNQLFGWNVRQEGVFTGSEDIASDWGNSYIFIPLGKYEYIWTNKTLDIYDAYDRHYQAMKEGNETLAGEIRNELEKLYRTSYKTTELSRSLNDSFEAIFNCDRYILIDQKHWEEEMSYKLLD